MSTRTALVTGGIGGLGTAICRALALQGRRVVAVDRDGAGPRLDAFQRAMHGLDVGFEQADVGDPDACDRLLGRVQERHGPVAILVNAAGIVRDARLVNMSQSDWDDVLRVNLDSVFNLCRRIVAPMCEAGFGRIVNISSVNAQTGQFGQTNYAAAKAGMHGFTMSLAREVARKGVTVNSISPGYIDTEMTRAVREDIRQQIVASIPTGRMGAPSDIARAVTFFCDDAAGYLTGVNLPVNGGQFMSF